MDRKKLQERIRELEGQNHLLSQKLASALEDHDKKDLLELTETKKQLESMMKIKEQFLLNMSHEIRTPMNAIIGFTGLLLKTNPAREQKEYIDAIRSSGENLMVIINDILDFSKIQAGKVQFEHIGFSLMQVIPNVIDLLMPRAEEKGIRLYFSIEADVPVRITGDPTRLNQILLNLISNAIKFTEKGIVKVGVRKLHDSAKNVKLEFSVSDTGIGIPANSVLSIFEEFTQASGNITRKYGGTGLGLAIVKQLVEAQNGDIAVKSKVGVGSVFSFTLVFGKEDAPDSGAVTGLIAESEAAQVVEGLSVLLVEDNPLNQKLATKILNDWNWSVDLAETGMKAIRKLKRKNYDIILMDVQLPEMNGYQATEVIRQQLGPARNRIPIIALTAHAMATEEKKCYLAGMNGYISKPFNPKKLYGLVLSVLKKNDTASVAGKNDIQQAENSRGRQGRTKMK